MVNILNNCGQETATYLRRSYAYAKLRRARGEGTLQLVRSDVHKATNPHSGGCADCSNLRYSTYDNCGMVLQQTGIAHPTVETFFELEHIDWEVRWKRPESLKSPKSFMATG